MRGHVRQEGKAWYVVVDLPRDSSTGKRKQKWHSGFKTRRQAEKGLTDILSRLDQGTYVAPERTTLAEYLTVWLRHANTKVRPSTFATYGTLIEKHIKPRLGSIPVQSLTAAHINAFYADLQESGRCSGKGGLSPSTIRYVHAVLRKSLKDAMRQSLVIRNVAEAAEPPRVTRKQINTWSARELRAFLTSVEDDRYYAAYFLAATTGMRRGEVLGLRWQDLDLETGRASIARALIVVGKYEMQFSEPKTARSRRMVALDEYTVDVLKEHRERQLLERKLMGDDYEDSDLVFAQVDGTPFHPDSLSDMFYRRTKAAGLPRIRFHDLRHTHATLALAAGVHPKVVSERLGHASIVITLDTYSHAIPAMQEEAATLVASLVFAI